MKAIKYRNDILIWIPHRAVVRLAHFKYKVAVVNNATIGSFDK